MLNVELTVPMPCLNEAEALDMCVAKTKTAIEKDHLSAEILTADNGSTDAPQKLARQAGAQVVAVLTRGEPSEAGQPEKEPLPLPIRRSGWTL